MDKWLSRIESCGWLSHIKDVLMCACLVAQCINEEGQCTERTVYTQGNMYANIVISILYTTRYHRMFAKHSSYFAEQYFINIFSDVIVSA